MVQARAFVLLDIPFSWISSIINNQQSTSNNHRHHHPVKATLPPPGTLTLHPTSTTSFPQHNIRSLNHLLLQYQATLTTTYHFILEPTMLFTATALLALLSCTLATPTRNRPSTLKPRQSSTEPVRITLTASSPNASFDQQPIHANSDAFYIGKPTLSFCPTGIENLVCPAGNETVISVGEGGASMVRCLFFSLTHSSGSIVLTSSHLPP